MPECTSTGVGASASRLSLFFISALYDGCVVFFLSMFCLV